MKNQYFKTSSNGIVESVQDTIESGFILNETGIYCAPGMIYDSDTKTFSTPSIPFVDKIERIRAKRNVKLAQSDWTQLSDSQLSSSKKAAWVAYRQDLRNLPATVTVSNVDAPVWPALPA